MYSDTRRRMIRYIKNPTCEVSLPWQPLIDNLELAMRLFSEGKVQQPVRATLPVAKHGGFFGIPTYTGRAIFFTKNSLWARTERGPEITQNDFRQRHPISSTSKNPGNGIVAKFFDTKENFT